MPKKDGTGPIGSGPMTGRGSGKCIIPLNTEKEELSFLKNQAKVLQKEQEIIKTRILALETLSPEKKK